MELNQTHADPEKNEWGNAEELPALARAFTLEPGTTFPIKKSKITDTSTD